MAKDFYGVAKSFVTWELTERMEHEYTRLGWMLFSEPGDRPFTTDYYAIPEEEYEAGSRQCRMIRFKRHEKLMPAVFAQYAALGFEIVGLKWPPSPQEIQIAYLQDLLDANGVEVPELMRVAA